MWDIEEGEKKERERDKRRKKKKHMKESMDLQGEGGGNKEIIVGRKEKGVGEREGDKVARFSRILLF